MEKEGEKKTVLLMSLNKRERTQTFKSRRKVSKPRTSEKKNHKSDLRLCELKTTNKVFLKNRITASLFSTMRSYTVVQKKNEHAHVPTPYTQVTQSKAPLHVYTFAQQVRKGGGKKLRPFCVCVCFVAFRTRYRKEKRHNCRGGGKTTTTTTKKEKEKRKQKKEEGACTTIIHT